MNKLYCDECGKEIEGNEYVQQIITNFKTLESFDGDYCIECWEKLK